MACSAWAILVPLIWLVPRSTTKPPISVQEVVRLNAECLLTLTSCMMMIGYLCCNQELTPLLFSQLFWSSVKGFYKPLPLNLP